MRHTGIVFHFATIVWLVLQPAIATRGNTLEYPPLCDYQGKYKFGDTTEISIEAKGNITEINSQSFLFLDSFSIVLSGKPVKIKDVDILFKSLPGARLETIQVFRKASGVYLDELKTIYCITLDCFIPAFEDIHQTVHEYKRTTTIEFDHTGILRIADEEKQYFPQVK